MTLDLNAAHDLHGLLELPLALTDRLERDAELPILRLVVAHPQPEDQPPTAEAIHVGRLAREQHRVAVVDGRHEDTEPDSSRRHRERAEDRPAVRIPGLVVTPDVGVKPPGFEART